MYEISAAAIVAVIIAVEQAFKGLGLPTKFVPLLNIFLGVGGAFLYSSVSPQPIPQIIFMGIVMGLTASGLYSGVKNIGEGLKGE